METRPPPQGREKRRPGFCGHPSEKGTGASNALCGCKCYETNTLTKERYEIVSGWTFRPLEGVFGSRELLGPISYAHAAACRLEGNQRVGERGKPL